MEVVRRGGRSKSLVKSIPNVDSASSFSELYLDLQKLIISGYLDPATAYSFSLTSKRNISLYDSYYTRKSEGLLFFAVECARGGFVELFSYVAETVAAKTVLSANDYARLGCEALRCGNYRFMKECCLSITSIDYLWIESQGRCADSLEAYVELVTDFPNYFEISWIGYCCVHKRFDLAKKLESMILPFESNTKGYAH